MAKSADRNLAEIDTDLAMGHRVIEENVPVEYLVNDDPELRLRIGRYLAVIRKKKQISQEAAAKAVHLTRPHMSNVELGRSRAGWSRLAKIARLYEVDIAEIAEEARVYDFEGPLVAETAADRVITADLHNKWLLENGLGFVYQLSEKEKGVLQLFVGVLSRDQRNQVCQAIWDKIEEKKSS